MLLGCPCLRNVNVIHDWGNNLITIESNGTMHTIAIIKHLVVIPNDQKYYFNIDLNYWFQVCCMANWEVLVWICCLANWESFTSSFSMNQQALALFCCVTNWEALTWFHCLANWQNFVALVLSESTKVCNKKKISQHFGFLFLQA